MAKLGDLIARGPITVERHEPLARAASCMYDNRIGAVCVTGDEGGLLGIFTERDLLRACAAGVDTHASTVGNWMTENPQTASPEDDAGASLQIMIDNHFRHLPVMGAGGLLGVVSMRALATALQEERGT